MFLLRLFWRDLYCCCVRYVYRCEFHEKKKIKRKKKRESQTIFLLSLNCHERSTESACRSWDSAEGCGAQERRPPSPWLPKATSCPKGKDLHFLLRRNTCINVISITHKAILQQLSHLSCLIRHQSHPAIHTCDLILADLMSAVEKSSEAPRRRKQTKLPMCCYAKPI